MNGLSLCAMLVLSLALAQSAYAQVYPSRPITVVVPFSAGGPVDTLGRIVTERMKFSLGQPLIIENVPGAGGSIGVARVARAAPDGYTLSLGNSNSHVASEAIYPVQYDLLHDFEPISLLPISRLMLVGRTALPANTVPDLVQWLKANPGKATVARVGVGSPAHLCALDFQNKTGTTFQFVPYRGGAPGIQDVIAGQVDLMCVDASLALAQVRGGTIKAFAIMDKARWPAAPEIPTIDEGSVGGLHIAFWHGLWAPKNTPSSVIAKLNGAVKDALADPAARERLTALGLEIPPADEQSPAALAGLQKAEIEKWWPIIKAANIKPQ
jgi:tripartite-type tricarboxylate transporter receptor subunit TctC